MAIETKIVTLYQGIDSDAQQAIAPRTKISAVSDENNVSLDVILKRLESNSGGGNGGSITIDTELSTTSENPVQNKVITTALAKNVDELKAYTDNAIENAKVFYVTVNIGENLYGTSDKKLSEINEAYINGSSIWAKVNINGVYLHLPFIGFMEGGEGALFSTSLGASVVVIVTETGAILQEIYYALGEDFQAHLDETNPHNITKSTVGLSNVDNTSDANKPVSTAQKSAIDTALEAAKTYADGKASKTHTHSISDVTNLQTTLDEINETANTQADWSQTDETAPDYIKNKPDSVVALEALVETGFVRPTSNTNNALYTNNSGVIYVL